jgi:hypothetical protein
LAIRAYLLLLFSLGGFACGHTQGFLDGGAGGPESYLWPEEQEVLALLDLAAEISASETVWPGFRTQDLPLMVQCSGPRTLVLGPFPGARPLPSHPALGPVALVPDGQLPLKDVGSLFLGEVQLEGVGWFVMRHQAGTDPVEWYRTLVHELFHMYQKTAFAPTPRPGCRYPYADCANFTALATEGRLLGEALATGQQCHPSLVSYAGSRLGRLQGASGAVAASIENQEERIEGSARFVEGRYALEAALSVPEDEVRRVREALGDPQPAKLQKWRYYESGRALLDLSKGRQAALVEAGDAPFKVLLRTCGIEVPPIPPRPDQALCEARIAPYLDRETSLLAAFEDAPGLRLRLLLPRSLSSFYSNQGLTFSTEDCRLFISGMRLFEDRAASLVVRQRPVFLQARRDDGLYLLEFKGQLQDLSLDGRRVRLEEAWTEDFKRSVTLAGEGFSLEFQGAGRLSLGDGQLTLEARPGAGTGATNSLPPLPPTNTF